MEQIETAGLGTRRFRTANLPPEMSEEVNRTTMDRSGEVKNVQAENWSRTFKPRVYVILRSTATAATPPRELRVTQIQPGI